MEDDKENFIGIQIIQLGSFDDLIEEIGAKEDYNAIASVVKEYLGLAGISVLNGIIGSIFIAGLKIGLQITEDNDDGRNHLYKGECPKCGTADSFIVNETELCIECSVSPKEDL